MRAFFTATIIGATAATLAACATEDSTSAGYAHRCSGGDEVAGALIGGGAGALAGSAIAGRGDRTTGAVLGGVAGAVVGSQVGKSASNCQRTYYDGDGRRYYYDDAGRPYYR
jgi:hypothetical protein